MLCLSVLYMHCVIRYTLQERTQIQTVQSVELQYFIEWKSLILMYVSSWMRHWATSRKVAGWISHGVIGIFHWHNPSGSTMALGSAHHLTEMNTKNISLGVKRPVPRADLTTFTCRLPWNLGAWTSWNPQFLNRPVHGLSYLFYTSHLHLLLELFSYYKVARSFSIYILILGVYLWQS